VRQVVGYDRFVGEPANLQLTELYRALRLYVNCFQPSMKLQSKQREGSNVRRISDQAQTPLQRLVASQALPEAKQQELERVAQALDPLRLLRQLEHLQKALWRYTVAPGAEKATAAASETLLPFSAQQCAEEALSPEGIASTPPTLLKKRRKEHTKSHRPRDWRTRADPFEGLWDEIQGWLMANPERTGVDIFQELQQRYPDRFLPVQVRTLQRNLHQIRANLLVTFQDQWEVDAMDGSVSHLPLRAEIPVGIS
jgi:hypothetical protein